MSQTRLTLRLRVSAEYIGAGEDKFLAGFAGDQQESTMSDTIVNMRFRLQPGRSRKDWLRANEQVNTWIGRQPGFRYRSLSETADGEWIVIVYWISAEAAEVADRGFVQDMGNLIFPFVDMDSFSVSHSLAHVMLQGEQSRRRA